MAALGSAAVPVVLEVLLEAPCIALGNLQRVTLSELQHFLLLPNTPVAPSLVWSWVRYPLPNYLKIKYH